MFCEGDILTQKIENDANDLLLNYMACALHVFRNGLKLLEFPLKNRITSIGRDKSCDLVLDFSFLSRRHAIIEEDENSVYSITDLCSVNGTKRNDFFLKPNVRYELRDGDRIYFGEIYCSFQCNKCGSVINTKLVSLTSASVIKDIQLQNPVPVCNSDYTIDSDTSSDKSEPILAKVLIDTDAVSADLLSNSSYFTDQSLSISKFNSNKHLPQSSTEHLLLKDTNDDLCTSVINITVGDSIQTSVPTDRTVTTPICEDNSTKLLARDSDIGCVNEANKSASNSLNNEHTNCDQSDMFIEESQLNSSSKSLSSQISGVIADITRSLEFQSDSCTKQTSEHLTLETHVNASDGKEVSINNLDAENLLVSTPQTKSLPITLSVESVTNYGTVVAQSKINGEEILCERKLRPKQPINYNELSFDSPTNETSGMRKIISFTVPKNLYNSSISSRYGETPLNKRHRSSGRVTNCILSDTLGSVQFRTRQRGRASNLNAMSDNVTTESVEEFKCLSNCPLIRKASDSCAREMTELKHKLLFSNKSRAPPIPSPLNLSDSIISDEASQLEEKTNKSFITQRNISLIIDNRSPEHVDTKRDDEKANEKSSSRKTAINLAGFDESQDSSVEISNNTSTSCSGYINKANGDDGSTYLSCQLAPNISSALNIVHPTVDITSPEDIHGNGDDFVPRKHQTKRCRPLASDASVTKRVRHSLRHLHNNQCSTAHTKSKQEHHFDETNAAVNRPNVTRRSSRRVSIINNCESGRRLETVSSSTKTRKSVSLEMNPIYLLFTGVEASEFKNAMKRIGAVETQNPLQATYLITDEIKRTIKVLYSRARGIPIVSTKWLKACQDDQKCKKPPDPQSFILCTNANDQFRSMQPVRRSRASRSSVIPQFSMTNECAAFLNGWRIYATPAVLPLPEELKKLTQLAGGHWMSDNEVKRNVVQQPHGCDKTVIITSENEFSTAKLQTRNTSRRESRRRCSSSTMKRSPSNLDLVFINALRKFVCVNSDWFLQVIMSRRPPVWPVDSAFILK